MCYHYCTISERRRKRTRARPDKTEDRMEGERKISHQDISHSTDRGGGGEREEAAGKPSYTPTDTFSSLPAETYNNTLLF